MTLDSQKQLLLIEQNGVWVDKTSQVYYLKEDPNYSYSVLFKNSPGHFFHYPFSRIRFSDNCSDVRCLELVSSDHVYSGFSKILFFPDIACYKVFYSSGHTVLVEEKGSHLVTTLAEVQSKPEDILAYYRELTAQIPSDDPEENPKSFLNGQFDRLDQAPEGSILEAYLSGEIKPVPFEKTLYFPFAFNESQLLATKHAFTSSISIVEGPPGTGKTQTILNIIANAIIQGKSVAVCSNNNAALGNVADKLTEQGYDDLFASLGNKDNIDSFFRRTIR
jgi:hypothetical protein